MNQKEIIESVIECVASSLDEEAEAMDENTLLITDLDADSLDIMDIMFLLEEKFEIKLQKEDFDFLSQIGLSREEAVVEGKLTPQAKEKLQKWLPKLKPEDEIAPKDLGAFLAIKSMAILVENYLATKSG